MEEINIVMCTHIKTRTVWVIWNNQEPTGEFSMTK